MRRRRKLVVAFSGVDGAGKSTQIELFQAYLRSMSTGYVVCWARGGYTPLLSALKDLLRKSAGRRLPTPGPSASRDRALSKRWVRRLWLVASIVDLALLYGLRVRWWRLRGKTVVCDRYLADTRFDFKLNFPQDHVESWWLWCGLERITPRPDVWFLLLLPVEESLRRCRAKHEPFPDSEERFHQRLQLYRELARTGEYVVVDARDSVDDVFAVIREAFERAGARGAD